MTEPAHSELFNRMSRKFEFIFETILDYESGDQMGSFDAKNRRRKSHALAPLSELQTEQQRIRRCL